MKTIYLVGCVKTKRTGLHPAKELYLSAWFRKVRDYVERRGEWFILSAKHFLLDPEQQIENYNLSLYELNAGERKEWAKQVIEEFEKVSCPSEVRVVIFAGKRYREFLVPLLKEAVIQVDIPLEGLGLGMQLQWLSRQEVGEYAAS